MQNLQKDHISKQYDVDLKMLEDHVLIMGELVQEVVDKASRALLKHDAELAAEARELESSVDKLEVVIDKSCTRILAKRQPAATDLRFIVGSAKAIYELEHIGDLAKKIAKTVFKSTRDSLQPADLKGIELLSTHVAEMLQNALDAYRRRDARRAVEIMKEDKLVDREYKEVADSLIATLAENRQRIPSAMDVLNVFHALERIGDHSRNLAEHVIYIVEGADVRHLPVGAAEQKISA